jgi:hypothetical protein
LEICSVLLMGRVATLSPGALPFAHFAKGWDSIPHYFPFRSTRQVSGQGFSRAVNAHKNFFLAPQARAQRSGARLELFRLAKKWDSAFRRTPFFF